MALAAMLPAACAGIATASDFLEEFDGAAIPAHWQSYGDGVWSVGGGAG